MSDPISAAKRLLADLHENSKQPKRERDEWLVGHEKRVISCLERLVSFQEGYSAQTRELTLLALRLLDAIKPLLLARGQDRYNIEGVAPRLREAYTALKERLENL